ncbi:hypothetical protein [Formosa sp. S-31]|uniref:hypothetical protein n=1 Tax=Formosa sp. S-31 TaxID=2790949 RepID=UPI003EB735C0
MDSDQVKFRAVFIYSKGSKRQLLLSYKEIENLTTFIRNTIKQEVTIINTNMGLDIYYLSSVDMRDFICKAFGLFHAIHGSSEHNFKIISLESSLEIKQYLYHAYLHWVKMPLLLTSYIKSFVIQLTRDYMNNIKINALLFSVWYKNLQQVRLQKRGLVNQKGELLIQTLRDLYLDHNYNPLEKNFILKALSAEHHN